MQNDVFRHTCMVKWEQHRWHGRVLLSVDAKTPDEVVIYRAKQEVRRERIRFGGTRRLGDAVFEIEWRVPCILTDTD
jgi:hypothetical protein